MTQITEEQREQLPTAAERVAGKLQWFYESLPADEQVALGLALRQVSAQAGEPAEDATGSFFPTGALPLIVIKILEQSQHPPSVAPQRH